MQNQNSNQKSDLRQRCFWFSVEVIHFIEKLPFKTAEQILAKQLLRAATSIGVNIVEAFGSPSKKDFLNFFTIALKSAKETKYWLYLFEKTKKGDKELLSKLIAEAEEISKMVGAAVATMKGKRSI